MSELHTSQKCHFLKIFFLKVFPVVGTGDAEINSAGRGFSVDLFRDLGISKKEIQLPSPLDGGFNRTKDR